MTAMIFEGPVEEVTTELDKWLEGHERNIKFITQSECPFTHGLPPDASSIIKDVHLTVILWFEA